MSCWAWCVVLRNLCKLTFAPNSLSEWSDSGAAVTPAIGSGPFAKQSASSWVAFAPPETGVWWRARLKATQIWFSILHCVIYYSWLVVHRENSSELLWGGSDFCGSGVITGKAQVETSLCLVIYTTFCSKTSQARFTERCCLFTADSFFFEDNCHFLFCFCFFS